MAENLYQATVLELNSNAQKQDGIQNLYLLNKNRCRTAYSRTSGADSYIEYDYASERHYTMWTFLIDETFATTTTALVTNGYTCGRKFAFTTVSINGVLDAQVVLLSCDQIVLVRKDLVNPSTNSIIVYYEQGNAQPTEINVALTLAQVISATTV